MLEQNAMIKKIVQCAHWHDLPESVNEAVRIVDDPADAENEKLVEMIEQTPELKESILKYMNSPRFALSGRVEDIKSAVVNLGHEIIRNFLAGYMTKFLLDGGEHERPAFSIREYWHHTLSTCLAAELLGEKIGFENRFRLFTYGLIHDIGIVVVEACFPHMLDAIFEKIEAGVPMMVAEKMVLGGVTHGDIGAWLCQKWNLDETGTMIVHYHHMPMVAPQQTTEMLLLYLGNIIGTRVYESRMKVNFGDMAADNEVRVRLGLTEEDIMEVDGEIDGKVEEFERKYVFV
mgnify:CR=1 FL=1